MSMIITTKITLLMVYYIIVISSLFDLLIEKLMSL
jgi:preprotein translocase subunit SecE